MVLTSVGGGAPWERALVAACQDLDEEGSFDPGFHAAWYAKGLDRIVFQVEQRARAMLHFAAAEIRLTEDVAEGYLHSEPSGCEVADNLDRLANYSNGTVKRIVSDLQARAAELTKAAEEGK